MWLSFLEPYNSLSVGNSLAAVATPVAIRKRMHTLTGIQWYSSIISFVQNFWVWVTHLSLLLVFLYMKVHTYMQYYTGFQLGFDFSIAQFWVWVVHGNSLSAPPWFVAVPVGKVGRHQVMLFMSACATAWPLYPLLLPPPPLSVSLLPFLLRIFLEEKELEDGGGGAVGPWVGGPLAEDPLGLGERESWLGSTCTMLCRYRDVWNWNMQS